MGKNKYTILLFELLFILNFGVIVKAESFGYQTQSLKAVKTDFVGERIKIPQAYSSYIKYLKINLVVPTDYQFLFEAKPRIKLMTSQGKVFKVLPLQKLTSSLPVFREIKDKLLLVEMTLYYCKKGKESLCLKKEVLFEIPLEKSSKNNELMLEYNIEPVFSTP